MNIIITGATGLVATELTYALLQGEDVKLFLISSNPGKLKERYKNLWGQVQYFSLDSFEEYIHTANETFHCCIHTAFARSSQGSELTDSLCYLKKLIDICKQTSIGTFVNISSQSVYGNNPEPPLWKEPTSLCLDSLYAIAKCSSELLTELAFKGTKTKWTNIRLCSVMENARFVKVFASNAINGAPIQITTPCQRCSFIDVRDVASALKNLIYCDIKTLEPVYNLGAELVYTISEVAAIVKEVGEKEYLLNNVVINECASSTTNNIGMDTTLFRETFHWKPKYSMIDMIAEMFELVKGGRGRVPFSIMTCYK